MEAGCGWRASRRPREISPTRMVDGRKSRRRPEACSSTLQAGTSMSSVPTRYPRLLVLWSCPCSCYSCTRSWDGHWATSLRSSGNGPLGRPEVIAGFWLLAVELYLGCRVRHNKRLYALVANAEIMAPLDFRD